MVPRPEHRLATEESSRLRFDFTEEPFSFRVIRQENDDVLFDSSAAQLVFETQYVRLRTSLPNGANLYGLGEHSDSFRLPTQEYKRTMWNSESPFIPRNSNLYGSHPNYLEHRETGSHGVFLLSSSGMDITVAQQNGTQFLEYQTIGGVIDLYFFAGPKPSDVSIEYAEAFGLPAMVPYWSLGYQQAKYGYWDVNYLAEVVANYSTAGIPLEVIWADIDYMELRKDFTTDPERFPIPKMREFVDTIHARDQRFVMMLDPGISTNTSYDAFTRGHEAGAFLKAADGSDFRGVQWAGEVVWPDYASQEAQDWWSDEIRRFFDPDVGMDIDGVWNDMNEPSNFCPNVDCNPYQHAVDTNTPPQPGNPPRDNTGRPIPGFPASFQPGGAGQRRDQSGGRLREARSMVENGAEAVAEAVDQVPDPTVLNIVTRGGNKLGLADRDLLNPPYRINNHKGDLSQNTVYTNVTNHDGSSQYDTHNMYGLAMVVASRKGLLDRRPGKRPFILTRSTFLTSGVHAAHWFGDNYSSWSDYRITIAQMLGFAAVHQMPVVGSDVCGFNGPAAENMCARWALLGAFQPFYRNHADISAPHQEYYLWESVTKSAKKAIDARYRLLDYIYTALYRASATGVPSVNPLFFLYPGDTSTYGIDLQWFLGDAILVSPVVDDDSQSVNFYLPDDIFYDFWTYQPVRGQGATVSRDNVAWDDMPVHIRGGTIVPMRSQSANTTASLRDNSFTLVVAQGLDGKASGSLYLDDGESLEIGDFGSSDVEFAWDGSQLKAGGTFGYVTNLEVEAIVVLTEDGNTTYTGNWSLDGPFTFSINES